MRKEIPIEIGKKYNNLTIIKEIDPKYNSYGYKQRRVECKCDCGKIKEYYFLNIKQGLSTSCGCIRDQNVRKSTQVYPNEYFINKKFGRLTVIGISEPKKTKKNKKFYCIRRFTCSCECGNITISSAYVLLSGNKNSCGCLKKEINGKHWDSTKNSEFYWLYYTWNAMMARCYNENCYGYVNYGKRGIKVFDEWHDYLKFKEWILNNIGIRKKGQTIDRINNDGNYEPNNIRWATYSEQNKNKRKKKKSFDNF